MKDQIRFHNLAKPLIISKIRQNNAGMLVFSTYFYQLL